MLAEYRASRNVVRCLSAPDLMDDNGRRCLRSLQAVPASAITSLFARLSLADNAEIQRIREILIFLLDDESLSSYYEGLLSAAHPQVLGTTVRILSHSRTYDPDKLLDLFDRREISRASLLQILTSRKEALSGVALLRKIYTLEPNERVAMFKILNQIADKTLVPELVNQVSAEDVNTRLGIVMLLSRFSSKSTHKALFSRLTDSNKEVRFAALGALSKLKVDVNIGVLSKLLRDPGSNVQKRAIDIIVKRDDPTVIKHLLDLLKDESSTIRRAAVQVLNGMNYPDALEDLFKALKNQDWWVRARAADALATVGGRRVIEAVVKLLRSDDEYIRSSAIEVLNSSHDETSMSHLIGVLSGSDWWVRERAIDMLESIGNKAAVPALIKLMREDRQAAPVVLKALRSLADEKNIKDIVTMLGSSDDNTVIETIHALSELVDTAQAEQVFKAIKRRAYSSSDEIRSSARQALLRINARLSRKRKATALTTSGSAGNILLGNKINIRALRAGDPLGERYEFIRRVGKGAFSTVLLVRDVMVRERIVLKVLHDKMTSDDNMIKRFIREIRYARRINHRHVIRIYDFISMHDIYAISMEYFPSVTLSSMLQPKKPLDFKQAISIAAAVAAGIHAAHKLRIVHRDLKPGNVLIDKKSMVKVVDFGIARIQSAAETQLTRAGILIGTPRYMAPEQVTGKRDLDGRSDIYSLGVLLHEMLTGQTAFKGDDNVQVLYKHVHGDIQPVDEVNPEVPKALSQIVLKMMSVNPKRRYQTMLEVEKVLRTYTL